MNKKDMIILILVILLVFFLAYIVYYNTGKRGREVNCEDIKLSIESSERQEDKLILTIKREEDIYKGADLIVLGICSDGNSKKGSLKWIESLETKKIEVECGDSNLPKETTISLGLKFYDNKGVEKVCEIKEETISL